MKTNLQKKTLTSLFIAIVILQSLIPWIGYIPIGPANVTIIHITVIAGGVILGPSVGAGIGFVWGALSLYHNMVSPTILSAIFLNPLVSILPRVCVGFLSGLVYKILDKRLSKFVNRVLVGVLGTITNTSLVIIMTALFASKAYAAALGIQESAVLETFVATLGLNFVLEVIVAGMVVPVIGSVFDRLQR